MCNKNDYLKIVLCLCLLLAATSPAARSVSGWTQIFEGIEYATGSDTSPRLMRAYALRIDLWNPDVVMFATPSNGSSSYETNLQTTPAFLDAYGLKAAVNANFYSSYSGSYADNLGLLISNGTVVSNAQSGTFSTQLNITSEMIAELVSSASNPTGIYTAVGGAEIVLSDGVIVATNQDVFPRTVLGLSQSTKYLIMVVIDGRQTGYSEGCTQPEAAQWLLDFGAYDGANFDGGGSSCLVRDNGSGSPTVLNSPSDGSARAVGANLGAYSCATEPTGPGAQCRDSSSLDIVTRGWDNSIMHNYWSSSGGWNGWTSLGSATYDSPTVCSLNSGRIDIWTRSTSNNLMHKYYINNAWSSWTNQGGNITSAPSAVWTTSSVTHVFARGSSNQLVQRYWDKGWSSWIDLGGTLNSAPSAICNDPDVINVFACDSNNNLVQKYYIEGVGWSSWKNRGGTITSAPSAIYLGDAVHVFARGSNNHLMQIYWNSTDGWSSWIDIGGSLAGSPAACTLNNNQIDVFYRGTDGNLYQAHCTSGNPWTILYKESYY